VRQQRLDELKPNPDKFLSLAPDFVIELLSVTDNLHTLRQKMEESITFGVRLGWLINPKAKQIEAYRPQKPTQLLESPAQLSGEEVLPRFVLDLREIWG
jgi:Uma2 family endonuclease